MCYRESTAALRAYNVTQQRKFSGTPTTCFSCHQKDFTKVLVPNHPLGKFSHDCLTCHTLNGWLPSIFQHEKTNFQLTGSHQTVDCASCHTGNRYAGLQAIVLHVTNKSTTKQQRRIIEPHNSITIVWIATNTINWKPSSFDHKKTNFPLLGAHNVIECSSCHRNGQFKGLPTDCFICHQQDFLKTIAPNHTTSQYSHDCTICHSMNAWKPSTFDHNKTNFQLLGAHQTVECSLCHKNGQYKGLATDCFICHQQDLRRQLHQIM